MEDQKNVPNSNNINIDQSTKYAGFIKRAIAYIIDVFLVSALLLPLALIIECLFLTHIISLAFEHSSTQLIFIIGLWIYSTWFNSSRHMGTPGKLFLRMKVVDNEGKRISFKRALLRSLLLFVLPLILSQIVFYKYSIFVINLAGFFTYPDIIVMFFDSRKRCLHDIIARTIVVADKSNKPRYLKREYLFIVI